VGIIGRNDGIECGTNFFEIMEASVGLKADIVEESVGLDAEMVEERGGLTCGTDGRESGTKW